MTTIDRNGITLSAHALDNMPDVLARVSRKGRGDYAATNAGRMRRADRRDAIRRKHAFLYG